MELRWQMTNGISEQRLTITGFKMFDDVIPDDTSTAKPTFRIGMIRKSN